MENGGSSLRVPSQGPKGTTIFPMRDVMVAGGNGLFSDVMASRLGGTPRRFFWNARCVYYFLIKVGRYVTHLPLLWCYLTLHNLFFNIILYV